MRPTILLAALTMTGCELAPEGSPEALGRTLGSARVLQPGCAGSAYATIQSAIDASANGDVIEICAGTYFERLTVAGRSITLRSLDGAANTVIDAQGLGTGLAISAGANVTVDDLTFANGHVATMGGNISCAGSTLALTDSRITGGSANSGGGLGSTCAGTVTGNTFDGNTAYVGGGAWITSDLVEFRGNTVELNTADDTGAGLFLAGSSDILGNAFAANASALWGGGAYVSHGSGDILDNTFSANTSVDDGAGLYLFYGASLVEGNTFELNDSSDEGGGLRLKSSTASIIDNVFTENHADYRGGGAKISHEAVLMVGNTFTSNSAWVYGGALVLEESSSLVTDTVFRTNTADNGGAVYLENGWDTVTFEDCRFISNVGNDTGGHFHITTPGVRTVLRRVEMKSGESDLGAAIYAIGSGEVQIENSLLRLNEAAVSGGGLYLDANEAELLNTVLFRNVAPTGAAFTSINGLAVAVTNTAFVRNAGGPAVRLESGVVPNIRYSDFSGNTSDFSGLPNVVGVGGNRAALPRFTSPGTGDFTLQATSNLINRGDPAISDTNGTRSDIGMHGGPGAP